MPTVLEEMVNDILEKKDKIRDMQCEVRGMERELIRELADQKMYDLLSINYNRIGRRKFGE